MKGSPFPDSTLGRCPLSPPLGPGPRAKAPTSGSRRWDAAVPELDLGGAVGGAACSRSVQFGEKSDLDASPFVQCRAAAGDRRCRLEVVGADDRVAAEIRVVAGLAERCAFEDRVPEVDEVALDVLKPLGPCGHDVGLARAVANGCAVGENELGHFGVLSGGGCSMAMRDLSPRRR